MNWTLRDNGWAFGLGAAILSLPITLFLLAEGRPLRLDVDGLLPGVCGSFGMLVACRSAYGYTRASGRLVERIVLLTAMSFGMAFALAATALAIASMIYGLVYGMLRGVSPFASFGLTIFLFFMTGLVAWGTALAKLGVPILGLTAVWSWLYLTTLGPRMSCNKRQLIVRDKDHDDGPETIVMLVWFALSIASGIAILIMKALSS